jgi:hypothetical protein
MAWEEIARGTNLNEISGYEDQVPEGKHGRLDLHCKLPVPSTDIDWLHNSLTWAGIEDLHISSSGTTIQITYRKGMFWIPLIITALIILGIAIMLWILFKEVVAKIGSFGLMAGAVLALAVSYSLFRRRYT